MLINFADTSGSKHATALQEVRVHLNVITASQTVYMGHTREDVEQQIAGIVQGFPVTQAGGPVEITWSGDLWLAASEAATQATLNIESFRPNKYNQSASQSYPTQVGQTQIAGSGVSSPSASPFGGGTHPNRHRGL